MNTPVFAYKRKGLALVVVMLIVLVASAVALVSLKIAQTDSKMAAAFQYNRQAATAAHQSAGYVVNKSKDDTEALYQAVEQHINGIDNAMKSGEFSSNNAASWYYPDEITAYSGLGNTPPAAGDVKTRLLGDLARPVIQAGSVGNSYLNNKPVPGFSDGEEFCSFTKNADSYALFGRSVPLRENSYYLLSDLNSRNSAFKREMGLLDQTPMSCKQ